MAETRGNLGIVERPAAPAPRGEASSAKEAAAADRIDAMSAESVSIVVPTYREAANLPLLVGRVFGALQAAGLTGELILVDDNSEDGTERVARDLALRYPVRLITRHEERGLSSAVVRGFEEARHELLLCMDADLSHPPEAIPSLVEAVSHGGDFVIGSRYVAGGTTEEDWGLLRRLNSRVATALARPLSRARDPMAGFFCLRRETFVRAKAAGVNAIGYKIGLELLVKAGCRQVVEVPIAFCERKHGQSKLTFKQQVLYLRQLVSLYAHRFPMLFPVSLGAILLLALGFALLH